MSPFHELSELLSSPSLVSAMDDITISPPVSNSSDIGDILNNISHLQFHLNFKYGSQIEMAIALILMICGGIFVLLGVRLFKHVLFLLTFFIFGGITYFIGVIISKDTEKSLIAAFIIGFFMACLLLKLWKLSLFACGAAVGFVMWLGFKSLFPNAVTSESGLYLLLSVPMIICGLLAIRLEKYWLLIATPVIGSFLFAQGLDYFIKQNMNVFSILSGNATCVNERCYYIYGGLFAASFIGILIQWKYTSGLTSSNTNSKHGKRLNSSNSDDDDNEEIEEEIIVKPKKKKKIKRVVYVDDDVPTVPV